MVIGGIFKRGDIVRPKEEAIEERNEQPGHPTGFRSESRLRLRVAQTSHLCSFCHNRIQPGEMYAASQEASSSLCLREVEKVPDA